MKINFLTNPPTLKGPAFDLEDYTFYVPAKVGDKLIKRVGGPAAPFSCETELTIQDGPNVLTGRALVCRCFGGKQCSITIRQKGEKSGASRPYDRKKDMDWWDRCQYAPPDKLKLPYCATLKQLRDCLAPLIFPPNEPVQGLILVSGGTGSAKSITAEGLIGWYLQQRQATTRRPHLVTFEEPIEHAFFPGVEDQPLHVGVDYTPRLRGVDARSLPDAFRDAKRQTPAVFYAGEVRDRNELAEVLDFAGSGHLVVTTAHGGTLTEALQQLFSAADCQTPADRGRCAQRLLAVLHQRAVTHRANSREYIVTAPALWRRTDAGVAGLVSDGLASVLPHYFRSQPPADASSLGRFWFTEQLLPQVAPKGAELSPPVRAALLQKAKNLDLRGL